jgi:hypothetical protein
MKFDKTIDCGDGDRVFHGLNFFSVEAARKLSAEKINKSLN